MSITRPAPFLACRLEAPVKKAAAARSTSKHGEATRSARAGERKSRDEGCLVGAQVKMGNMDEFPSDVI